MRILMVCLGNICRSPLAEGILSHLAKKQKLDWQIASAGTGNWHVGLPPDQRSIAVAKSFGYDISAQRAQHFSEEHFEQFDYILVMDNNNYHNVLRLAKTEQHLKKVMLFLGENNELADPYYDDHLFEPIFKIVEKRCKELIYKWKDKTL